MSRAAYAKLQSAQFPQILDRHGKLAEVIDGSSYIQFNLQKEEADSLSCNQLIIQFLAYSRTLESMRQTSADPRPKNVFFTFQFYRFPEFKTPKLVVTTTTTKKYSNKNNENNFYKKKV